MNMDSTNFGLTVNDLRVIVTTLSFVVFVGIVCWALSARQKSRFDEAANLPFLDDDTPATPTSKNTAGTRTP